MLIIAAAAVGMEECTDKEGSLLGEVKAQLRFLTLNLQWHQSVKLVVLSSSVPHAGYWDSRKMGLKSQSTGVCQVK